MRVGLREANQRFSWIVRVVKAGRDIVLTERGKSVAIIRRTPDRPDAEETLDRLAAAGLLRPPSRPGPLPPFRPRSVRGAPLAATIREDREAR